MYDPLVAPVDIIRRDFAQMDAEETLRCNWDVEQLILIQSIEGHAHEGHGAFKGRKYPNTTIDDIARALSRDPHQVRSARMELIDQISDFVDDVIAGKPADIVMPNGDPLLTVGTLRYIPVEPEDVLRGLYMGGLRDDPDVRAEVEHRTGWIIGGGRGYLVNKSVMRQMNLDGYKLAKEAHQHELDDFRECGLIVDASEYGKPDIDYMYVRHRVGPGASDDSAVIVGGKLWNLSVAIGVFLADAVDTLEKYIPTYGDWDGMIARRIEEEWPDLGLTRDDVYKLTFLSSVPIDQYDDVPDCSLRYMLQLDRHADQCALESHLLYVMGRKAAPMRLGHDGIPSSKFYEYIENRLNSREQYGF